MASGRNKITIRKITGENKGVLIPKCLWRQLQKQGYRTGQEAVWLIGENGEIKLVNLETNQEYREFFDEYGISSSDILNTPRLGKYLYDLDFFKKKTKHFLNKKEWSTKGMSKEEIKSTHEYAMVCIIMEIRREATDAQLTIKNPKGQSP